MLVNDKNYRTIWMKDNSVFMIDQTALPHRFDIFESKNHLETADAIKKMIVRGAPAIGAAGAFGIAQAAIEFSGKDFENFKIYMKKAEAVLKSTRPTAHDLFFGVNFVLRSMMNNFEVDFAKKDAVKSAMMYADWNADLCRKIGEHGNKLIKENAQILTHCNAGALACVDYGTALAPIRMAHYDKKNIFVFADETRPRNQGASLTSWELSQEKIPHSIIADNAAGFFMKDGKIDMVIVGADRIAMNGDVANKIGTYEKAVLAKENNIPFYVAAPLSTFDSDCKTGGEIPIEERHEDEIHFMHGVDVDGNFSKFRISPKGSSARNPAFDVTPARYITGIITESGIVKPQKEEIEKFISENKLEIVR